MANDEFDNRLADKKALKEAEDRLSIKRFLDSENIKSFLDGAVSVDGYELDYDSLVNLLLDFKKDCGL